MLTSNIMVKILATLEMGSCEDKKHTSTLDCLEQVGSTPALHRWSTEILHGQITDCIERSKTMGQNYKFNYKLITLSHKYSSQRRPNLKPLCWHGRLHSSELPLGWDVSWEITSWDQDFLEILTNYTWWVKR